MKINELQSLLEKEKDNVKDLAAVNKMLDEVMGSSEETPEEEEEKKEEETPEETPEEKPEETPEETPEEKTEEVPEEPKEEPTETINLSAVFELIESQKAEITSLKEQVSSLTATLSAKTEEESKFIERFKTLSAKTEEHETYTPHQFGMTNGIGDFK